jgi:hypothetical protein
MAIPSFGQAQPQPQISWAELALFSISAAGWTSSEIVGFEQNLLITFVVLLQ